MEVKSASSVLSVMKGNLKENNKELFIKELKEIFQRKTNRVSKSMKEQKIPLNLKDSTKGYEGNE